MSFYDNPLLHLFGRGQQAPELRRAMEERFTRSLDTLEKALGSRTKSRYVYFHGDAAYPGMPPRLVRHAEELTRRVWATGGAGSNRTEHELLKAVATAADVKSLPFFRECLLRNVPRQKNGPERRAVALHGVAILARGGKKEAEEYLLQHLSAATAELRAAAVRATCASFGKQLPSALRIAIESIAQSDTAFAPRFLARRALLAIGAKPIQDVPSGSYTFTAVLRRSNGIARTVELLSQQSLDDLARAVLDAFGWDTDHLYCFYFDERDRGGPFTVGLEEEYSDLFSGLSMEEEEEEESEVTGVDGGGYEIGYPIGTLGLVERQRFVFHFDFGDDHRFDITVDAISERAPAAKLPRIIARKGRSPHQYPSW